jgi:hypothetical protein
MVLIEPIIFSVYENVCIHLQTLGLFQAIDPLLEIALLNFVVNETALVTRKLRC